MTRSPPSTRRGARPAGRWGRWAPPDGAPSPIGNDGLGQNFAGGKIFYTPATGANVVTGQVLAKYESVGGPEGDLGFPTTSEVDGGLATASRMSRFAAEDKPVIFWTPDYGAVIVRGAMNAAWDRLGGAKGALGAPMADQTENGNVITQRFSGGVVSWDRTEEHVHDRARQSWPPIWPACRCRDRTSPRRPQGSQATSDKKWFVRSWWWLLAIVPVVVLLALVTFATMRRRGARQDDQFDYDDSEHSEHGGDVHAYGTVGCTTADEL